MNHRRVGRLSIPAGVLAAGLGLFAQLASAAPSEITPAEIELLPKYCVDTQGHTFKYGRNSPRAPYWVSLMGPSFWHMHHYCWALVNIGRARRASTPDMARTSALEEARGDIMYVLNNAEPDFILFPEIYSRLGEVELMRGQALRAEAAFAKARELKPDYWPAYFHWAEYLRNSGKRAEALKLVTSGLEQAPEALPLQKLYLLLGGVASQMPKVRVVVEPPAAEPGETTATPPAAPLATPPAAAPAPAIVQPPVARPTEDASEAR